MNRERTISFPPHVHGWRSSAKVMWITAGTLLPVVLWSIVLYGKRAAFVWLTSLVSALLAQLLADLPARRLSLGDGSAVMTGLIVACAMPPTVPLYVPALASAFGILAVKAAFGGLGANWMNPALGGLAFAYLNWPVAMREFVLPRFITGVDGVSASTPLAFAKGLSQLGQGGVMDTIAAAGYPISGVDRGVTGFLNDALFGHLGARLPEGYVDLAIGLKPGALGECGLALILAASIVLLAHRIIKLEIPLAMLGGFAVLARVFGTGLPGEYLLSGDALYALSGGGLMVAAFYAACDPVTSPVSRPLAALYGFLIGALCFAFRRWGSYTEGAAFAIMLANMLVPAMERRLASRKGKTP